jgi:hypothetical protein
MNPAIIHAHIVQPAAEGKAGIDRLAAPEFRIFYGEPP